MKNKYISGIIGLLLMSSMVACTIPAFTPLDKDGMINPQYVEEDNEEDGESIAYIADAESFKRILCGTFKTVKRADAESDSVLTVNEDGSFMLTMTTYDSTVYEAEGTYTLKCTQSEYIPDTISLVVSKAVDGLPFDEGSNIGDMYVSDIAIVEGVPAVVLAPMNDDESIFSMVDGVYSLTMKKNTDEVYYGVTTDKLVNTGVNGTCFRSASKEDGNYIWIVENEKYTGQTFDDKSIRCANKYRMADDCEYRMDLRYCQGYEVELTIDEKGEVIIFNWYCGEDYEDDGEY